MEGESAGDVRGAESSRFGAFLQTLGGSSGVYSCSCAVVGIHTPVGTPGICYTPNSPLGKYKWLVLLRFQQLGQDFGQSRNDPGTNPRTQGCSEQGFRVAVKFNLV